MASKTTHELQALRQALERYVRLREAQLPAGRALLNQEMADLLLSLLSYADRLDVDLLDASEKLLEQRASKLPRLVHDSRTARSR